MKKYGIVLYSRNEYMEIESSFQTDSPKTALNKWLAYSRKSPTMANICCGSKEDCMELYQAFIANSREFYKKYWVEGKGMAYKFDYLLDVCKSYTTGRKTLYFSGSKQFYDSVYPFCLG